MHIELLHIPYSRLILRGANFCVIHGLGLICENFLLRKFNTWKRLSVILEVVCCTIVKSSWE